MQIVQVERLAHVRGRLIGDRIEGRSVLEPELIRQKGSSETAVPAANDAGKTAVRCRQIIRGGRPQTVPLTRAKTKFQSHERKCQCCNHRLACATA